MMQRVFIAGASIALNYKNKNPHASESEIMSHITREMKKSISNITEGD